ncbi:MAG TPA: DUF2157 domain-containing protein [Candidatus Limnocylindrales bacterium]|nr:DUF2157 domain-containing protein [Candidatus Limnocylindrales bacterium]
MNIDKKLTQWRAAGHIDETTAARIAAFEQSGQRPILLYALGGLGALTLGIGIISVVASNWQAIPRTTKLGMDLALGLALALALFRSATRVQLWLTDVLAGIYYAFVLGSIALIGQVYQLGSPQYQGLVTWSLTTIPFMLLVRGRLLGAVWLAGLAVTQAFCFAALFDWLDDFWSQATTLNLAISLTFASLLGYIVIARARSFVRARPHVSEVWTRMSWTAVVASALAISFAFYDEIDNDKLSWAVAVCGVLAAGMVALLPRLYPEVAPRARTGMALLLASVWLLLATATTFDRAALPVLGAIVQVAVLGIAAWTVLALGSVRSFNTLTALIALRVLVMYFEVFGSMLDTGLGMISGGLLTLLLAWLWKRKSPELAERLSIEGTPDHAS